MRVIVKSSVLGFLDFKITSYSSSEVTVKLKIKSSGRNLYSMCGLIHDVPMHGQSMTARFKVSVFKLMCLERCGFDSRGR